MATTTYNVAGIREKNKGKPKSLSAQERTVLSRMEGEEHASDELALEDTTTQSERAADEGLGFFGKIDRFFSRTVEINFNGTIIKGKNGHQVRGGVVPLFPGAVLDLTPAFLKGRIDRQKHRHVEMEAGGKPKVMLSPRETNFIMEHEVDDMHLETTQNKDEIIFRADVQKPVEYERGSGGRVRGSGLVIHKNAINILEPTMEKDGLDGPKDLDSAAINESGIVVQGDSQEQPKSLLEQIMTADIHQEGENYTAKLNLKDGTFKFNFGTDFLDSEGEDEDEEEQTKEAPSSIKALFKEYYDDFKEEAEELWDKLKFAKTAFAAYCKTGELPENKFETEEEEEKEDGGLSLDARFMLFPGVYFNVELSPVYSFGINGGIELCNANELEGEYQVQGGQIVKVTYPDIEKIFAVTVGLRGKVGATLSLTLSTGIGYLLELAGGVWANGTMEGNLEGGTFAQTTVELGIHKRQNESAKLTGPLQAQLAAGVDLKGSVGMSIKTASKLFDWEKELYNYTFKEWHLGDLRADLTLVKNEPDSPFTSIGSWKRENSSLELNAFGGQILNRKKDKYGLRVEENDRLETMTINTSDSVEKMEAICLRIREIRQQIGENNVVVAGAEGSEAYNRLMEELKDKQEELLGMVEVAEMDGRRIDKTITAFLASDQWIQNNAMANEGIKKHVKRANAMEEWSKGFHGQEETRDQAALARYRELYKGKGAKRAKSSEDHEKAVRQVASRENLIHYEEGRLQERQKKHQTRLDKLESYMAANNIQDLDTPNSGFLKYYKELGGKMLLSQMGKFGDRDTLLQYEKGRREEKTKKHTERIALLTDKQRELKIGEDKLNEPNPEFTRYYKETLKGSMMFEHLLDNHLDINDLLNYEEGALETRAGDHVRYVKALNEWKKQILIEPDEKKGSELEKKAILWYKDVTKTEGKLEFLTSGRKAARTASKQDILMYEKRRLLEYQTEKQGKGKADIEKRVAHMNRLEQQINAGQGMEYAKKVQDSSLLSNKDDYSYTRADGTTEKANLYYIKEKYKKWSARERADEDIKSMLSLDMILHYEEERLEAVKRKKDKEKHQKRIDWLKARIKEASAIKNQEERKLKINKIKETYYTGKGNEIEKGAGILTAFREGKLNEPGLMLQSMKDAVDSVGDVHRERLRQLRDFMGIPQPAEEGQAMAVENTSASERSDAEVWQFYKSIGGGSRFRDEWGGDRMKKDTVCIDDLIRYESIEARKASRQNAFTRNKKLLLAGKEERDELNTVLKGGHFERYQKLIGLIEQGKPDEEIIEAYKKFGGGKHYEKMLEEKMISIVTPGEIFKYERGRASEIGAKHDARIAMLEGEWKDLSYEQLERNYREMVEEDGTGKKDRLNSLAHHWNVKKTIGYDKAVDPEKVMTPKMILEYEKKRKQEVAKSHSTRLAMLNAADDDTTVWEKYKEAGGGKRFQRDQKERISQAEKGFAKQSWGYDQIMAYEQERVTYYKEVLEKAKEPLQKLREARAKLEISKRECEKLYKETSTFTAAEGLKKILGKAGGFQEFADKIAGANIPGKFKVAQVAAEGTKQAGAESENIVEAVTELAKEQQLIEEGA